MPNDFIRHTVDDCIFKRKLPAVSWNELMMGAASQSSFSLVLLSRWDCRRLAIAQRETLQRLRTKSTGFSTKRTAQTGINSSPRSCTSIQLPMLLLCSVLVMTNGSTGQKIRVRAEVDLMQAVSQCIPNDITTERWNRQMDASLGIITYNLYIYIALLF